jgi:Microsomal signal peptidase 25 kDa subunit (SPC25)
VKKYDPTYNIDFRLYENWVASGAANVIDKKSFAEWFDKEGTFVRKPFNTWLGINIVELEKKLVAGKRKKQT